MVNTVEYDRVRRGIQQDCNALLENVKPMPDWLGIAAYTVGILGTLGMIPLCEIIAERRERGYVAGWRRLVRRRLQTSLGGPGSKERVVVLSYGGDQRSVVTEIHLSRKVKFLGLVGDDAWHYCFHGGSRSFTLEPLGRPDQEVLEEYRAIVDSVKWLQQVKH